MLGAAVLRCEELRGACRKGNDPSESREHPRDQQIHPAGSKTHGAGGETKAGRRGGWREGRGAGCGTSRGCPVGQLRARPPQDDDGQDGVPRVGLYILQEERCWELLPPEEELEAWIAKLQLVIWGQARRLPHALADSALPRLDTTADTHATRRR